jgi:hypothetical protein
VNDTDMGMFELRSGFGFLDETALALGVGN